MEDPVDLIIPVYLNQKYVFDLVAMLKGGIATVTKVYQTEKEAGVVSGQVSGSFGLSQALSSLLKVSLSGKADATSEDSTERALTEERVHTPSSLFYVLRKMLNENQVLKIDSTGFTPRPGDFVEFSASLRKNPLVEALDSTIQVAKFFSAGGKQGGKPVNVQKNKSQQMQKHMESLSALLKEGETLDLTTEELASNYRTVITLETKYLNDPLLSDLVDGTFRITGKIVRVVKEGEGAINLLRKTALSRLPIGAFKAFTDMLQKLESLKQSPLPKLEWEICSPVIQVLPIAIFA